MYTFLKVTVISMLLMTGLQAEIVRAWEAEINLGASLRSPESLSLSNKSSVTFNEPAFNAGLSVGYRVLPWIIPSVSAHYLQTVVQGMAETGKSVLGNGREDAIIGLANVAFEWPVDKFRPYAGAGVGVGHLMINQFSDSEKLSTAIRQTAFSWSAFAGLKLQIMPVLFLGLGYRFIDVVSNLFNVEMNAVDSVASSERYSTQYHSFSLQLGANF